MAPEDEATGSDTVVALARLYDDVDRATEALAGYHRERLRCRRGCSPCCVDGIRVFVVEADHIRRRHGEWLRTAVAHRPGACAFLDTAGACRIYADRPYVCRTQGLPLRWIESAAAGEVVELRDICPLNEDGGPPVEDLPVEQCWSVGPVEGRLALLQRAHGSPGERVALRDLFRP